MKKIIAALSALAIASVFAVSATAQKSIPADWAQESFDKMNSIGAIPEDILTKDYAQSIGRRDFAELIYYAYNAYKGKVYQAASPKKFDDMQYSDEMLSAIYELEIMQGDENNEFHPDDNITRQETAVVINNFYTALTKKTLFSSITALNNFNDRSDIADWAKSAVSSVARAGYMGDYGDGAFHPLDNVTIEQAVSMVSRMDDTTKSEPDDKELSGSLSSKCTENGNHISISWNKITNADEYTVIVTESRNHKRSGDIEPLTTVYTTEDTSINIPSAPGRTYSITVEVGNISEDLTLVTSQVSNNKEGFSLPETQEEAEHLMQEIEINVWKINSSGEKYASTALLTVHKDIADTVYDIFQEIFEGDEQFPIESVGGYAWRGGKSEHNWGTAIDINPTQNYCIYTSGAIVGDHWLPYEDSYSITPYGDVMNAFENHGFTWGGDAWSGNVDYMHFSYFGT